MKFSDYQVDGFFDEMFDADMRPRPAARMLAERIEALPMGALKLRQQSAEKALHDMGITFYVYGGEEGSERIWPFDIIPRVIDGVEWDRVERGLRQRIVAINHFVDDVYHDQKIVKDGVLPEALLRSAKGFLPACMGLNPPRGIWCHVTGSDLVRDADGTFYVLEDNLRVPSGVSYVLANRDLMKRTLPEVFGRVSVRPVADYPTQLLNMIESIVPAGVDTPTVGVLTPGRYNSAYYEHSLLAREIGAELVEGEDLVVSDGTVCMRTTRGLRRIDVLYRRVNDEFLDPHVFRPDSVLGVPGLMEVYRAGRIGLANAPGTGVADDKVIYAFVPEMIRYYLGEEAILPNVPTHLCCEPESLAYTLDNLESLVVKPANESGGYGLLVGPKSTRAERDEFARRLKADPRNYISQPTISLSRSPVLIDDHVEGRHLDLRPFVLYGEEVYVMPGGLTRVALKPGSLVVNSSQGGGSKDTWVVDGPVPATQEAAHA